MLHIPAELSGGLQLLLERLESGTAEAADQQWAAKLLRIAKTSPQITERGPKAWRDWGVFQAVEDLKNTGMSPTDAYKEVAKRIRTSYSYEGSGGKPREMSAGRVKGIYRERKSLSEYLEEWAERNPDLAFPDRFED